MLRTGHAKVIQRITPGTLRVRLREKSNRAFSINPGGTIAEMDKYQPFLLVLHKPVELKLLIFSVT